MSGPSFFGTTPVPLGEEMITRAVQAAGCCGAVSLDGKYACIIELGHDGPHGWENRDRADAEMQVLAQDILDTRRSHDTCDRNECCYPSLPVLAEFVLGALDRMEKRDALLAAAYIYLDRFVSVEEALIDGFNLAEWCRQADALGVEA